MLRAPCVGGAVNAKSPPGDPDGLGVLLGLVKVDAGTRTRRCQYIEVTI
jgi:hypothetical protein